MTATMHITPDVDRLAQPRWNAPTADPFGGSTGRGTRWDVADSARDHHRTNDSYPTPLSVPLRPVGYQAGEPRPGIDRGTTAPAARAEAELPGGLFARRGVRIDQARFWVGALLTAAVAALVGIIGMVVANGILHIPTLAAADTGPLDGSRLAVYSLTVGVIALGCAALYLGMLYLSPRPTLYFGWIAGLGTLLVAVLPFALPYALSVQVALATINVLTGAAIVCLVPFAAVSAGRQPARS